MTSVTTDRFAPRSPEDTARLVHDHPLAWVVSADAHAPAASLLPLRPVFAPDGEVVELIGHFARVNPQVESLKASGRALILFLGPHGYISPRLGGEATQAPTWNYASVQFLVDIVFTDSPDEIEALLRDLVAAMECEATEPWSLDEMGTRYAQLSRRIIGFRGRVLETRPKFKLGQDERDDLFANILHGLEKARRHDLSEWMRGFDAR